MDKQRLRFLELYNNQWKKEALRLSGLNLGDRDCSLSDILRHELKENRRIPSWWRDLRKLFSKNDVDELLKIPEFFRGWRVIEQWCFEFNHGMVEDKTNENLPSENEDDFEKEIQEKLIFHLPSSNEDKLFDENTKIVLYCEKLTFVEIWLQNPNLLLEGEFCLTTEFGWNFSLNLVKSFVSCNFAERHKDCTESKDVIVISNMNRRMKMILEEKSQKARFAFSLSAEILLGINLGEKWRDVRVTEILDNYFHRFSKEKLGQLLKTSETYSKKINRRERQALKACIPFEILYNEVSHFLGYLEQNGVEDEDELMPMDYFLDLRKKEIVLFFYQEGWYAVVFVESPFFIELPVFVRNGFFILETVPDISRYGRYQRLLEEDAYLLKE